MNNFSLVGLPFPTPKGLVMVKAYLHGTDNAILSQYRVVASDTRVALGPITYYGPGWYLMGIGTNPDSRVLCSEANIVPGAILEAHRIDIVPLRSNLRCYRVKIGDTGEDSSGVVIDRQSLSDTHKCRIYTEGGDPAHFDEEYYKNIALRVVLCDMGVPPGAFSEEILKDLMSLTKSDIQFLTLRKLVTTIRKLAKSGINIIDTEGGGSIE